MHRSEMIKNLSRIDFGIMWPEDDWEDIGFTERPIWINGTGYGCYTDQQSSFYKVSFFPFYSIKRIKNKILNGTINYTDIADTPLSRMLYFEDEINVTASKLKSFLSLPNSLYGFLYCVEDECEDIHFYTDENDAIAQIRIDSVHHCWEDMDTDMLRIWTKRIFCEGRDTSPFELIDGSKLSADSGLMLEAKGDALLRYSHDMANFIIPFSAIYPYWNYATEDDFEGGYFKITQNNYIIGLISTASMQGGVVFVWDMINKEIVHISEGSYAIDAVLWNDEVYSLCAVSNYSTPFKFQICKVPFKTKDAWREPSIEIDGVNQMPAWDGVYGSVQLHVHTKRILVTDNLGRVLVLLHRQ